MKPIVITKDANGNVQITEDEFRRIIDETYNTGYESGYNEGKAHQVMWPKPYERPWWEYPWVTTTDHIVITCEAPTVTL